MKNQILKFLLKGTWHVCDHNWECKKIGIIKCKPTGENDYLCTKCGVASRTIDGVKMILINVKNNHPWKFDPWQIPLENCNGIRIN